MNAAGTVVFCLKQHWAFDLLLLPPTTRLSCSGNKNWILLFFVQTRIWTRQKKKKKQQKPCIWDSTLKICTFRFAVSHYQMIGWLTGSGAPLTELWLRPHYSSVIIFQLTPLIPNQGHSSVRSFPRVGAKDTPRTGHQQDTHQCHSNTGDKANMDVLRLWEETGIPPRHEADENSWIPAS